MEFTISLAAVKALMDAKETDDPEKIKDLENKLRESMEITKTKKD